MRVRQFFAHPLAPLCWFAVALAGCFVAYLAAGYSISPKFEIVAGLCWAWLLVWWIVADSRRRQLVPCFDYGFLCAIFFPVSLPWYCFWSRGWRGGLTLGLLFLLWIAPYVVAAVAWTMLYGG